MEFFLQDLKHSLRMFWQSRGFTAAAVAALALGIGLNTGIFSVVNSVLLKPPPFPDPERMVLLMNKSPQGQGTASSPAKFQHWREQTAALQDVAGFRLGVMNWTGGEVPEQLRSGQVTSAFFPLFGVEMRVGRPFGPEEDKPNAGRFVVISEGLWGRRFGADPAVIGRTMLLGGDPYTILGVVAASFDFQEFGPEPEVWVPFQLDPNSQDQGHYFMTAARLQPGVTVEQARTVMNLAGTSFRQKYPTALQKDDTFSVDPLREALVNEVRSTLLVLSGAVGMVLLIACANVANLLLARAISRRREIAIRAAIGAGRGRIIRQLLTESLLLSALGGVLGTGLGMAAIRALLSVNTAGLPRIGKEGSLVTIDWRVLAFTGVITVLTSLLFGLIPALQASRADLSATLKEGASRSGSGFRQNKARTLLVVSELALAVVLLIGAALLIRTSLALGAVQPGFQAEHVLTMRQSLAGQKYMKTAAVDQLTRDVLERLRALPGVQAASATCCVPLVGGYGLPFRVMGRPLTDGPFHGGGGWKTTSPGMFEVFNIAIKRGRDFNDRDTAASQPVVMINETMAKKFWPNGDPLNERILIGKGIMSELEAEQPRQIVGIVSDVRDGALNRDPEPTMFVPNAQVPDPLNALNIRLTPIAWVVRTQGEPMAMSAAVQEQIRQVTGLPVSDIRSMSDIVSRSTSRERFNMLLMTVFGGTALLLAAIGVYGLMAYSVQQRTQEIGIRMALGAETGDVQKMILWQGMRFALIGVATGTVAALAMAKVISTFLFGVTAWDPSVFVAVPALLTATAFLAILLPALRATRVDPIHALRYE